MILVFKNQAEWTKAEENLRLQYGSKAVYLTTNNYYQTIHTANNPGLPPVESEESDGTIKADQNF